MDKISKWRATILSAIKCNRPPPTAPSTRLTGLKAEHSALTYLAKKGLKLKEQNFYSRFGEIDLIMEDKQTLVFVEVRFRKNKQFVDPLETITQAKQQRIIKTAEIYLMAKPWLHEQPCRFDVVSVMKHHNQLQFNWIKNAFY